MTASKRISFARRSLAALRDVFQQTLYKCLIKKAAALAELTRDSAPAQQGETKDTLDFAISLIGNFGNSTTTTLTLRRGATDSMQESMAIATIPYRYHDTETGGAVYSAISLAAEMYHQIHGHAHRTTQDNEKLQESKRRASTVTIQ